MGRIAKSSSQVESVDWFLYLAITSNGSALVIDVVNSYEYKT